VIWPTSIGTGGAINTITSMVLISIHPFALRKIFLVIAALLCFSALCLADPVFVAQCYGRSHSDQGPFHDVRGVDLRSRGQESLPLDSERAADPAFEADGSLPPLVILGRFVYS
jgi:hypothetical protein